MLFQGRPFPGMGLWAVKTPATKQYKKIHTQRLGAREAYLLFTREVRLYYITRIKFVPNKNINATWSNLKEFTENESMH